MNRPATPATPDKNLTPQEWALLPSLRLLANADIDALKGLLSECPVREIHPDEVLIQPGEPNHTLYLVLSGRLRVHLDKPEGQPYCLIGGGESVGELSVIDQRTTSAFVVGDATARLLEIRQDLFWALVGASHTIASNMLTMLAKRLRTSNLKLSESERLQQVYRHHAITDELTGLHNRRWLENVLKHLMENAVKNEQPFSLLMIDVDYFKRYNDTLGHLAGDQALYTVAQVLHYSVLPTDTPVRFGGEEFVVVLPETNLEGAKAVAERIRENVAGAVIMLADKKPLPSVTVSIGVAQMKDGMNTTALIAAADSALYRAKDAGRNRVSE